MEICLELQYDWSNQRLLTNFGDTAMRSLLLISLVVCGCSTKTPAEKFTNFAKTLEPKLVKIFDDSKIEAVKYDVQTTDSVISPFTATITFSFLQPYSDGDFVLEQGVLIEYAYQEAKWTCKKITMVGLDLHYLKGDKQRFQFIKDRFAGKVIAEMDEDVIYQTRDKLATTVREVN